MFDRRTLVFVVALSKHVHSALRSFSDTAKEVPVEADTSVQGIFRAQRRIGCKARNSTSADSEEVGLGPHRGGKNAKLVGIRLVLLRHRPWLHRVGRRRTDL